MDPVGEAAVAAGDVGCEALVDGVAYEPVGPGPPQEARSTSAAPRAGNRWVGVILAPRN